MVLPNACPPGKRFAQSTLYDGLLWLPMPPLLFGGWGFWQSPIGTVRMQINPDVRCRSTALIG